MAPTNNNGQFEYPEGGWSKYKGVSRLGSAWRAMIMVNGKLSYLGLFGFESDAAIAYNYHAAYYHGEFAKLNTIPPEEYTHD
jgi:hypothetical protein